jgi:hypothetical protein
VERVILIARLKPGSRDRADELIAEYGSGKHTSSEFERTAIFLCGGEVIFFLEGHDARETMRNVLNHPVQSTWLSPWLPLFEGPLHAARRRITGSAAEVAPTDAESGSALMTRRRAPLVSALDTAFPPASREREGEASDVP